LEIFDVHLHLSQAGLLAYASPEYRLAGNFYQQAMEGGFSPANECLMRGCAAFFGACWLFFLEIKKKRKG
jgi:hypothetical protein